MIVQVPAQETGPDAPVADTPAPSERPEWLPEGFNTPEEFRAAYDKMQANHEQPQEKDEPQANPDDNAQVNQFVEGLGLNMDELTEQFMTEGSLSAEAREKLEAGLEKAGLPKSMVDRYIEGEKAKAAVFEREIYEIAGSKEDYEKKIAPWAASNLSDADLEAFNDMFNSGDASKIKFAMRAITGQYKAANRTPGKLLKGTSSAAGGEIFQSMAQQIAAQSDPRYRNDPAYRKSVEEKVARTLAFNQ